MFSIKKILIGLTIFIIIIVFLKYFGSHTSSNLKPDLTTPSSTEGPIMDATSRVYCEKKDGVWLQEYQECEKISKELCEDVGGQYFPCESVCRHDPDVDACIELCVSVCKFE